MSLYLRWIHTLIIQIERQGFNSVKVGELVSELLVCAGDQGNPTYDNCALQNKYKELR